MILSQKLFKISLFLLVFSLGVMPASAAIKKKQKVKSKKTRTTSKSSNLVQSPDSTAIVVSNKDSAMEVKLENLPLPNIPAFLTPNKPSSSDGILIASRKEAPVEQKEMETLSSKLGITIKDPSFLNLYREVSDWLGTRYRRGGMSRKGVDCSGFTNIIYNAVFDKKIERVSYIIAKSVTESLEISDLIPGDLVFFATNRRKKSINHVGVYLGDGHFAHASCKYGVIVSSLTEGYYNRVWRKGGRLE